VSPRTVNIELSLLRRMFNLGILWDKCESNPVSTVKFYREDPPTDRVLSEDEEQRLLECSAEHIKPIIVTALNTGLRYGELINLQWQDIDFRNNYLEVRTSKTGKGRKVPMNDTVKETLEQLFLQSCVSYSVRGDIYPTEKYQYLQMVKLGGTTVCQARGRGFNSRRPRHYNTPDTTDILSEYVFVYQGRPVKSIRKAFSNACTRAGVKNLRFHDLRHTFASRLVLSGVDLVTVSKLMGHSSITMTMRYSHPTPESLKNAVTSLDKG